MASNGRSSSQEVFGGCDPLVMHFEGVAGSRSRPGTGLVAGKRGSNHNQSQSTWRYYCTYSAVQTRGQGANGGQASVRRSTIKPTCLMAASVLFRGDGEGSVGAVVPSE